MGLNGTRKNKTKHNTTEMQKHKTKQEEIKCIMTNYNPDNLLTRNSPQTKITFQRYNIYNQTKKKSARDNRSILWHLHFNQKPNIRCSTITTKQTSRQ